MNIPTGYVEVVAEKNLREAVKKQFDRVKINTNGFAVGLDFEPGWG